MGKTKKPGKKAPIYPLVSLCTPTYNRRPFIETMFECYRNQTYPKNRIEWVIVDDGTDKIEDLVQGSNIPEIKYFKFDEKMTLGAKRNFMHSKSTGSIIVYMDDDDYYPPERISHAVERLQKNKQALCAGSSELYIYFKHIKKMYQCGPYGPQHATAGTFAFKKELLSITKYNEKACLAEEKEFLHNYTIPFVQLDPLKTILVFSHIHNTYDKKKMLENPNPQFTKESDKTIEMFIKYDSEASIKRFFLKEIDNKLDQYKPGDPKMKPDVLKQIKELEVERAKMIEEKKKEMMKNMGNNPDKIVLQQEGKDPITLTMQDAVEIMNKQNKEILNLRNRVNELELKVQQVARQSVLIKQEDKVEPEEKSEESIEAQDKDEEEKSEKSEESIEVEEKEEEEKSEESIEAEDKEEEEKSEKSEESIKVEEKMEDDNHRIRMVNVSTGNISTIAGTDVVGYSGDEGAASLAQLKNPEEKVEEKVETE